MSEETVDCGHKTAGAISVDMLCEESVCSADDEAEARPDNKKKRRTEAPSVRSQCLVSTGAGRDKIHHTGGGLPIHVFSLNTFTMLLSWRPRAA